MSAEAEARRRNEACRRARAYVLGRGSSGRFKSSLLRSGFYISTWRRRHPLADKCVS